MVSTHFKNMSQNGFIFPKFRGKKLKKTKKSELPPPFLRVFLPNKDHTVDLDSQRFVSLQKNPSTTCKNAICLLSSPSGSHGFQLPSDLVGYGYVSRKRFDVLLLRVFSVNLHPSSSCVPRTGPSFVISKETPGAFNSI